MLTRIDKAKSGRMIEHEMYFMRGHEIYFMSVRHVPLRARGDDDDKMHKDGRRFGSSHLDALGLWSLACLVLLPQALNLPPHLTVPGRRTDRSHGLALAPELLLVADLERGQHRQALLQCRCMAAEHKA